MKHIPACTTAEAGVLLFEDALRPTFAEPYDRDAWIYVPDHYSEYRYILGTRGSRPLICVGVNPSTAAPGRLDNTLKSAQRVAAFNGFDSFVMFNVYAQRATVPDDMEKEPNPVLCRENLSAFDWLLGTLTVQPVIWAAWGAVIEKRNYLPRCVLDMARVGIGHNARWVTAGARSKAGHPHHPLYLKADSPLDPFDVESYCETLIERMR